jgi:hypothetical protein
MLVGRIEEARIVMEYVTPDITEEQLRDIEVCKDEATHLAYTAFTIVHACSRRSL